MATIVTNKKTADGETVKYWGRYPEDAKIESSPLPFKALGKIMRIRNDELCRAIRAQFGDLFHDLKGVNLVYVNNQFVTEFYFELNTEPLPEGKIRNLINLTTPTPENRSNLFYRNAVVQNKLHGKVFTLNDETKLLLSDFMYGGRTANKPNNKKWEKLIEEIRIPAATYDPFAKNADRIFIRVVGFDIRRLAQNLYGPDMIINTTKDTATGEDQNLHATALYEVRFIKLNYDGTFIINIEQFDKNAAQQFVTQENPQLQRQAGGVTFF